MSENSGAHTPAPPSTPQAHISDVNLNGKTLFQVAAFAVAAAMGGGGVSLAAAPREELAALKTVVETVALSVNEIGVEIRYGREARGKIEAEIDALEKKYDEKFEQIEGRMRSRELCACRSR